MGQAAAAVGSVLTIGGIFKQKSAIDKQTEAQERINEIQLASQQNEDAARLRQQAREARRQRATILQASENLGTSGSSKEIGALSTVSQQQSQNFARVGAQQATAAGVSLENQRISAAQRQQATGRLMQDVGTLIIQQSGGLEQLFTGGGGGG